MLPASFGLVAAAVLLGTALALLHLRPAGPAPRWQFGALHGLIGASGLAALLLALQGPPRGVSFGVGPFGLFSAVVLALALLAGLTLLAALRLGRRHGFLMAVHAALAVTGFVILAAYAILG
ncbi:MAG TPA: hypothetical protein VMF62_08500 [Acetobacteraceae bacterium]|jgi:hypothetical protein|nr:hypothetical protein [Acetobacteraceae bacterium]